MRHNSHHFTDDPDVVRQLIRENPWAILVSSNTGGLAASHYPILLDEEADGLAIFTHVGRPDEQIHGFGESEIMLIVQGRHGYISPSGQVRYRHAYEYDSLAALENDIEHYALGVHG